ncbi:hypothetical protein P7C71_g3412, partial [Lecanoromycetidae sp. Uapishka_2]
MDSMRSLNTSLPRSPRMRRSNPPPEQLIQSFKSAALSVTNLYKTAAADQARAREAGYQDALDDVLAFLDRENLGLGDGEGWKVRKWATERLDGSPVTHAGSDSDEDRGETVKRARSSSPPRTVPQEAEPPRQVSRSTSPVRTASAPTVPPAASQQSPGPVQGPEIFSFRSVYPYPQELDMQISEASNTTPQSDLSLQGQIAPQNPAVRFEVHPRGSRTPHRSTRHNNRSTGVTRSLGTGAGSKRNFRAGDFFDFGNLGDGKDTPGGGGKRGRYT